MKSILFPTDFSPNADHALNFAIKLAKRSKAKLLLVHAFHITYVTPDMPFQYSSPEQFKQVDKHLKKKLKSLGEAIHKKHGIICTTICREGLADDVILELSRTRKPDLIVMGTKGASGLKAVLIGSNTARVIDKSSYPVLVVPDKSKLTPIKRIVYATDYRRTDISALEYLCAFAGLFKAKISVLHVSDEEVIRPLDKELMNDFKNGLPRTTPFRKLDFHLVYGKNTDKKIQHFVNQHQVDLLAMATHHRTIFERLFGISVTKQLAFHTSVPLLVFHYKKDLILFT